jgi:transposase
MIVIGTDPHKQSHTAAALDAEKAEQLDELTVKAREAGHERLLAWARTLDAERVWAIEDCRHVSGGLERFLLRAGERVVRVPPKLMAGARRSARDFGKSDPLDADAVARAAIRIGIEELPQARLSGPEREIALLLDHREDLVAERTRIQSRLRWLLHDIDPCLEIRERSLDQPSTLKRLSARLRRMPQSTQVGICRELVHRCSELSRRANELECELRSLVKAHAPQLLILPGCGVLTAAKLLAEVAGVDRFSTDAKLAKLAGVAPLDASSGKQQRHRLNRTGNRQLNLALHRIAITQARVYAPARIYLARCEAEGKTRKEALRALKRHLARRVHRLLSIHPDRRAPVQLDAAISVPCLTYRDENVAAPLASDRASRFASLGRWGVVGERRAGRPCCSLGCEPVDIAGRPCDRPRLGCEPVCVAVVRPVWSPSTTNRRETRCASSGWMSTAISARSRSVNRASGRGLRAVSRRRRRRSSCSPRVSAQKTGW